MAYVIENGIATCKMFKTYLQAIYKFAKLGGKVGPGSCWKLFKLDRFYKLWFLFARIWNQIQNVYLAEKCLV